MTPVPRQAAQRVAAYLCDPEPEEVRLWLGGPEPPPLRRDSFLLNGKCISLVSRFRAFDGGPSPAPPPPPRPASAWTNALY